MKTSQEVQEGINRAIAQQGQEVQQALRNAKARVAATEQALQQVQLENQRLRTSGLGALPQVVAGLGEAVKEMRGGHAVTLPILIDLKGIGRPDCFRDQAEKFPAWARKTENFVVAAFGEEFRQVLTLAVDSEVEIIADMLETE